MPLNIFLLEEFLPWVGLVINSRRAMPTGKQIGLPKDIPCVLSIAGVDQLRNQVSFSSMGPCYWEGVKFFSDYPFGKPLQKPDLTAFPMGYPVWNVLDSHRVRSNWTEVEKDHGASLVLGVIPFLVLMLLGWQP